MADTLRIVLSDSKKEKPQANALGFGKYFTDHMFVMDYVIDKGWYDPRIIPFQNISLHPAAKVFHYGQTIFEGLKAYRTSDNRTLLFRPRKNLERLNLSNQRLCIPPVDETMVLEALKELIKIDEEWIPASEGTSLYIRPFVIATEPDLGVSPSTQYKLMIILSPVGAYYAEGVHPVKIYVENQYVRAVRGGTGAAKTAGNYASGLAAQEVAGGKGYAQVLWLDGVENKYVEEVGSMNVFFKINGEVVTPALNGSILNGVTRDSVIQLLKHLNVPVVERSISIDEVQSAYDNGVLEEAFGTGTAAVISPIGELNWRDRQMVINDGRIGEVAQQLYDQLTGIQTGRLDDPFGWTVEVK
ncbi:branched-chain amino acid aminotransferase [Alicyclobacillus dauci]|uniref:Branched-chain-amino-acid aminotransferase n=1 Tax=Alicyclobacillus dauci TaxID=1475485 RepID=A0ABY6YXE3_9BACL|nr:branched-chain amino acid aminotransferase [Alicyclobacillus dauci]WAH35273.1 branched-chain amino acid aminotransferase [Alicyclobacillus dauci]